MENETDDFFPASLAHCIRTFLSLQIHPGTTPIIKTFQVPVFSCTSSWILLFQFSAHTVFLILLLQLFRLTTDFNAQIFHTVWDPNSYIFERLHLSRFPALVCHNELALPFFPFFRQWQLQLCSIWNAEKKNGIWTTQRAGLVPVIRVSMRTLLSFVCRYVPPKIICMRRAANLCVKSAHAPWRGTEGVCTSVLPFAVSVTTSMW